MKGISDTREIHFIRRGLLNRNEPYRPDLFRSCCVESKNGTIHRVRYWEIIADNLSQAGWSWGCVSAVDSEGRTIWIADAHRGDGKRFVVRGDEKLAAFLELEGAICAAANCLDKLARFFRDLPDMKTSIPPVLITFALICFALSQRAQAVSPPPPGGYPNFTTAAGDHALHALTLGLGNTAIGTFSLFSVTTGNFNTAVGAGALDLNTADSNTATGAAALLFNTTGTENTANGTAALEFNDTGSNNTATGAFALFSNTEGSGNTAVGSSALTANTTGNSNTAIGISVLVDNVSGFENVGIGGAALFTNIDGHDNIAVGQAALSNNTSGNNNIGIGFFGGLSVTTSSNVICIGTQGQDMSDSCFIGQIFGATVPGGSTVVIDANNRLGTMTSSRRFKEDIEPMDKASETLFALKPVVFRYKKEIDPAGTQQLGLVAEEVEKVNPELVVHDKA